MALVKAKHLLQQLSSTTAQSQLPSSAFPALLFAKDDDLESSPPALLFNGQKRPACAEPGSVDEAVLGLQ